MSQSISSLFIKKHISHDKTVYLEALLYTTTNGKGPLDWISTANALTDALTDAAQPTKLDHLSGEKTRYLLDLNR